MVTSKHDFSKPIQFGGQETALRSREKAASEGEWGTEPSMNVFLTRKPTKASPSSSSSMISRGWGLKARRRDSSLFVGHTLICAISKNVLDGAKGRADAELEG